jgi:glutathione S-transferase
MKLYDWDFAPNCRRVRMFLLEKGIEIPKEECITPAIALASGYVGHYKHAMVPMLELDDGTQLGEALSIWLYFETLHPNPPLMGTTALEKAAWLGTRRSFATRTPGSSTVVCRVISAQFRKSLR